MKRIYLSGGMEYAADEGRNWRDQLESWLMESFECEIFNPNTESDRFFQSRHPGVDFRTLKEQDSDAYREIAASLVDIDCAEIALRTDLVICYWDESAARGAGTKGELTIARYFKKPVFMVTTIPKSEIPGWVLGCVSRCFSSFEELKAFLPTAM